LKKIYIYVAKNLVISDTVGFTAFHMLVLGLVYMGGKAIFIVRFQHVSPVFPLFLRILLL
jgi:hypothetical protein